MLADGLINSNDLPRRGQRATLAIGGGSEDDEDENPRRVHGEISRASIENILREPFRTWIKLRLVPRLWRLKRGRTRRIFQNMTTAQIVTAVLNYRNIPHQWNLKEPLRERAYSTQYDESDLAYITRILADEGISFYFEQTATDPLSDDAVERVTFFDRAESYPAIPTFDRRSPSRVIKLSNRENTVRLEEAALGFQIEYRGRATAARLRSYDYRATMSYGDAIHPAAPNPPVPDPPNPKDPELRAYWMLVDEFVEHNGNDERQPTGRDARVALEQYRNDVIVGTGMTDARLFAPGYRFVLDAHDASELNREFVLVRVTHEGKVPNLLRHLGTGANYATGLMYSNSFVCAPSPNKTHPGYTVRPVRKPRPITQVTETAIVVGPTGEEIFTDALGRVKVQFHWDRAGQWNENSSCWVRTAMPWAGAGFGVHFVPRIGTEVLVTFLGGDPDRPVIIGCLYNGSSPTPEAQPEQKTRSTIRTRSSPGGGGFNALSFEDAAGQEEVLLRAERDLREVVGNDHTQTVHKNQTVSVAGTQRTTVGSDRHLTINSADSKFVGNEYRSVVLGSSNSFVGENRAEQIHSNAVLDVGGRYTSRIGLLRFDDIGADWKSIVGASAHIIAKQDIVCNAASNLQLFGANRGVLAVGGQLELRSDDEIVLRVGESSISINGDRILIDARTVIVRGEEETKLVGEAGALTIKGDSELVATTLVLSSDSATVSLNSEAVIEASTIKLKSGGGSTNDSEEKQTSGVEQEYWQFRVHEPGNLDRRQHQPLKSARFLAQGHGPEPYEGTTDETGIVRIPVVYEQCNIEVEVGNYRLTVVAGEQPAQSRLAYLQRLHHLGYGPADVEAWSNDTVRRLVKMFQREHGLPETGQISDAMALIDELTGHSPEG